MSEARSQRDQASMTCSLHDARTYGCAAQIAVSHVSAAGVANEVLSIDDALLEDNTRKVKHLFAEEMTECVQHGTCARRLWLLLASWRRHAIGHTKAIEGTNSMIKQVGTRCPNISLELLSSRIVLKKALAVGNREGARWSTMRNQALGVLKQCLASECEMRCVLDDTARWTPPLAAEPSLPLPPPQSLAAIQAPGDSGEPARPQPVRPQAPGEPARPEPIDGDPASAARVARKSEVWAASYSMSFHRAVKRPCLKDVFAIEVGGRTHAAVCSSKHHSLVGMFECELRQGTLETFVVLLSPLRPQTTVSMIQKVYDDVHRAEGPRVIAKRMRVAWDPALPLGTAKALLDETEELFELTPAPARKKAQKQPKSSKRRKQAQGQRAEAAEPGQPAQQENAGDAEGGQELEEDDVDEILNLLREVHDLDGAGYGSESDDDNNDLADDLAEQIDEEQQLAEPHLMQAEAAVLASAAPDLLQSGVMEEAEEELILNSTAGLGNFSVEEVTQTRRQDDLAHAEPVADVHSDLALEHTCQAATQEWLASVKVSVDALQHRQDALQRCTPRTPEARLGPNLSLVEVDSDQAEGTCKTVQFVHWVTTSPDIRGGRRVYLDECNKVVFSVASMVRQLNYKDATIVHPDIGTRMIKARKADRPLVCQQVLRLKFMLDHAITTSSLKDLHMHSASDLVDATPICTLCGKAEGSQCSFCCLGWHSACSARASRYTLQEGPQALGLGPVQKHARRLDLPEILSKEIDSRRSADQPISRSTVLSRANRPLCFKPFKLPLALIFNMFKT